MFDKNIPNAQILFALHEKMDELFNTGVLSREKVYGIVLPSTLFYFNNYQFLNLFLSIRRYFFEYKISISLVFANKSSQQVVKFEK